MSNEPENEYGDSPHVMIANRIARAISKDELEHLINEDLMIKKKRIIIKGSEEATSKLHGIIEQNISVFEKVKEKPMMPQLKLALHRSVRDELVKHLPRHV